MPPLDHLALAQGADGRLIVKGGDAAWAAAGMDPRDYVTDAAARIFGDEVHRVSLGMVDAAKAAMT